MIKNSLNKLNYFIYIIGIRFRNQKGQTIADGTLKVKENVLTLNQTTKSFWLPKIGYAFKL
ncbi:hypothetical protein [Flavobacterium sp.]|uniref:hypothetical protein n=1 Tax=Flavobacterium sp. TaxID=239 RepID=UPI003751A63D